MVNYHLAIIGTGVIGNQLAEAMQKLGSNLYAVANRTYEKGAAFAKQYQIGKVYDAVDDVFNAPYKLLGDDAKPEDGE
ncbi:MAG: NAD(P)-binding domain-containing protein [Anaerovoracaceae bacterium]|jgi:predicted dehydrogenase